MDKQHTNQISLERLAKAGIQSLDGATLTVTSHQGCDFVVTMGEAGDSIDISWAPQEDSPFKEADIQAKVYIHCNNGEISLGCDYEDNVSISDLQTSSVEQILLENELAYHARKAALKILESVSRCSNQLFVGQINKLSAELERQKAIQKQADDEQRRVIDVFASRHVQVSETEARNIVNILKRQADEKVISESIQVLLLNNDGSTHRKGLHCTKTGSNQYFWFQADGKIVPEKDVASIISTSWKEKGI